MTDEPTTAAGLRHLDRIAPLSESGTAAHRDAAIGRRAAFAKAILAIEAEARREGAAKALSAVTGEALHNLWVLSGRPDPFGHDGDAWIAFATVIRLLIEREAERKKAAETA